MFSYIKAFQESLKKERYVIKITFDISRYGKHKHSLIFEEPLSEIEAIYEVENWLSQPASRHYYRNISDDLFMDRYEDYMDDPDEPPKRGDFLGDAKYLETIERRMNEITLFCRS